MNSRSKSLLGFVAVVGLLATATACGSNGEDELQPDEAKQNAVAFLRRAMDHEHQTWPEVPDPVATRCADGGDGVRFQYLVTIRPEDRSRGTVHVVRGVLEGEGVGRATLQEDFGKSGVAYSATARADGKPWGSFQFSERGISLYVDSQCAEGSPDDYEDGLVWSRRLGTQRGRL